jgi:hypothetical protein
MHFSSHWFTFLDIISQNGDQLVLCKMFYTNKVYKIPYYREFLLGLYEQKTVWNVLYTVKLFSRLQYLWETLRTKL